VRDRIDDDGVVRLARGPIRIPSFLRTGVLALTALEAAL
jgi:hypothetical protein